VKDIKNLIRIKYQVAPGVLVGELEQSYLQEFYVEPEPSCEPPPVPLLVVAPLSEPSGYGQAARFEFLPLHRSHPSSVAFAHYTHEQGVGNVTNIEIERLENMKEHVTLYLHTPPFFSDDFATHRIFMGFGEFYRVPLEWRDALWTDIDAWFVPSLLQHYAVERSEGNPFGEAPLTFLVPLPIWSLNNDLIQEARFLRFEDQWLRQMQRVFLAILQPAESKDYRTLLRGFFLWLQDAVIEEKPILLWIHLVPRLGFKMEDSPGFSEFLRDVRDLAYRFPRLLHAKGAVILLTLGYREPLYSVAPLLGALSDVVLSSSKGEGYGLAVAEAFLATDVRGALVCPDYFLTYFPPFSLLSSSSCVHLLKTTDRQYDDPGYQRIQLPSEGFPVAPTTTPEALRSALETLSNQEVRIEDSALAKFHIKRQVDYGQFLKALYRALRELEECTPKIRRSTLGGIKRLRVTAPWKRSGITTHAMLELFEEKDCTTILVSGSVLSLAHLLIHHSEVLRNLRQVIIDFHRSFGTSNLFLSLMRQLLTAASKAEKKLVWHGGVLPPDVTQLTEVLYPSVGSDATLLLVPISDVRNPPLRPEDVAPIYEGAQRGCWIPWFLPLPVYLYLLAAIPKEKLRLKREREVGSASSLQAVLRALHLEQK